MSAYIKNFKMPPPGKYRACVIVDEFGARLAVDVATSYADRDLRVDPIVPVPTPGRLKKRIVYRGEVYDAIEAARVNSLDGILTDPYKEGFHDGLKSALQILANKVKDAPVIILEEEAQG